MATRKGLVLSAPGPPPLTDRSVWPTFNMTWARPGQWVPQLGTFSRVWGLVSSQQVLVGSPVGHDGTSNPACWTASGGVGIRANYFVPQKCLVCLGLGPGL